MQCFIQEKNVTIYIMQPAQHHCSMGLHNLFTSVMISKAKTLTINHSYKKLNFGTKRSTFCNTWTYITTLSLGAQLIGHDLLLMRSNKEQECKVRNKRVRVWSLERRWPAAGGWMDGRIVSGRVRAARQRALGAADPWSSGGYKSRAPKWIGAARAHEPRSLHTLMMHKKVVPDPDWDLSCARARGHSRDRAPTPRSAECRTEKFAFSARGNTERDAERWFIAACALAVGAMVRAVCISTPESRRRQTAGESPNVVKKQKESDRFDHFLVSIEERSQPIDGQLRAFHSNTGHKLSAWWNSEKLIV